MFTKRQDRIRFEVFLLHLWHMKCYLKYKRCLKILGPENFFATLIIITQNKGGGLAVEEHLTWRIEERASLFEWWVHQPYKKPLPISKEDKLRKQNRELIPTLGTKNTDPVNKLYRTWKWNIVKIKSTVTLHMYNIYWPLATKGIHVMSL